MRIQFVVVGLTAGLLCNAPAPAVVFAPEPQEQKLQQLADALIPAHLDQSELPTLFRLQLVAGRYREAETTLAKLAAMRQQNDIVGMRRLVPWQLYARAHVLAGGHEANLPSKFEQAFRDLMARLDDRSAVELLPLFSANIPAARADFEKAVKACPVISISCEGALELVLSSAVLHTWSLVAPLSERLLKEDMARRFIVDDQLLVPTPDGARISTLVIRPRTSARLTSLLNFTIYAYDSWALSDAAKMAANGYVGVVAYTRGLGKSPGPTVPYIHDGQDATAVIEWLAKQSWSDGRVGMFSGSYNAFTQWSAVKHMPKALKAIATNASNAPGIDTPTERGIFANFFYPWPLYTSTAKRPNDALYFDSARWAALSRNYYLSGRPYRDLQKIDGQPNPVFAEWLQHPSYDSYWQKLLPFGKEFARIKIPVFVQTGYFDGGMVGALYYLREHYKYDPNADHRLLIGPYHHTAMTAGVLGNYSGYDVDAVARVDLQDIRLKWFDHVFRGAPLPELLSDKINFEVMGANRWRHAPTLGAMGSERLRLYLCSQREGDRLLLANAPPSKPGALGLSVDFKNRTDVDYQPPSQIFSREIDARNALVFSTMPLDRPTEINGSFLGRLSVVVNKRDFDLSIALYEQLPDGRYFPLSSFIGRASYLADRTHRNLLQPGLSRMLSLESDRMTSRLVGKGSRIVATVGVLKQPDYQINYGTGRDVSDESIADAGAPLRLAFGSGSYLELRVNR